MTLRRKTLIFIIVVLIFSTLTFYFFSSFVLISGLSKLEKRDIVQDIKRVNVASQEDINQLDMITSDWAGWDDTYYFVENKNLDYIESNLVDETFKELKLNLMMFLDSSSKVVILKFFDLNLLKETKPPEDLYQKIIDYKLALHENTESSKKGFILLSSGPMMVASRPIITSEKAGPIKGTLIMGAFFDSNRINRLSKITGLSLISHLLTDEKEMDSSLKASIPLLKENGMLVKIINSDIVSGFTVIEDLNNYPFMVLRFDQAREVYKSGKTALYYLYLSLFSIGVIFAFLAFVFLGKLVFNPLLNLGKSVEEIGKKRDFSLRVEEDKKSDELSKLASTFNKTLEALYNAHDKIKKSEEEYKNLFERMREGFYRSSRDGRLLMVNPALVKMFGYDNEEDLLSVNIPTDLYEDPALRGAFVRKLEEEGELKNLEIVLRKKDNTKITVLENSRAVRDEKGNLLYFEGTLIDITEKKLKEEELKYRIEFEKLISVISTRLINIKTKEVDSAINEALKTIGSFVSANRSYIFILSDDKTIINNTHEWCKEWVIPQMENLQNILAARLPLLLKKLNKFETIYKTNEPDSTTEMEKEIEIIKPDSPPLFVIVPMIFEGTLKGFLGFDFIETSKKLSSDIISLLKIIGEIFSNTLERKKSEEKLKYLSIYDPLTGLYNRAFFEDELKKLEEREEKDIGILICDLDGLKLVNDALGHGKGDALLIEAAKILKKSAREQDITMRIGGDEFAIIVKENSKKAVEKIHEKIRGFIMEYNEKTQELPLSLSMGFAASNDIFRPEELFQEADNNMYREKLYRSQSSRSAVVQILKKAMEERDISTGNHHSRLLEFAKGFGEFLSLSLKKISDLVLLAQFHDIGKVGIPDRILWKKGRLTKEEKEEIEHHPEIGYRIAQSAPDLVPIADLILKHHEWWNGEGYPLGLKGEDIPIECRILSIIDAYDTMRNGRIYKEPVGDSEAIFELKRYAGIQFDQDLVLKFIEFLGRQVGGVKEYEE